MNLQNFFLTFVPIFVAVDCFGTIPIFLMFTRNLEKKTINTVVKQSVLVAFLLGIVFIFVGKLIFNLLGITISDFMIAGGSLLFILSIKSLVTDEEESEMKIPSQFAAVPLGTPLMAGPAVLTALILLVDLYGITYTLISFFLNMVLTGFVLIFSHKIKKLIGENGIRVISKVVSLFLAAIAVMLIRKGFFAIIKTF